MTDLIPRAAAIMAMQALTPKHSQFTPAYIVDAQAALRAIPAAQVAVKPLEWEEIAPHHAKAPLPLFGSIRVESWGGPFQIVWSVPGFCDTFTPGKFPTIEAAKAAAQADYDTCTRAAITATPIDPAQIWAEALRDGPETIRSLAQHLRVMADLQIDAIDSDRLMRAAALLDASPSPRTAANAATCEKGDDK